MFEKKGVVYKIQKRERECTELDEEENKLIYIRYNSRSIVFWKVKSQQRRINGSVYHKMVI